MFVVFEGLDKSGKTTLEWELLKATNFKNVIIDRGPVGYVVFDKLFKRRTKIGDMQYAKDISVMKASDDFIVVYCKADVDVVMKRLSDFNESCPYDYEYAQGLYDKAIEIFYKQKGIKVVTIDTIKPIEECVKTIVRNLKEVLKSECD